MVYSVPLGLVPLGKGSIKSRWLEKVDWGGGLCLFPLFQPLWAGASIWNPFEEQMEQCADLLERG